MQERDAQITILIGRNGTGKSTFCERIIKAVGTRALVLTYNGAPKIWRSYKEVKLSDKRGMRFKRGIRTAIAARYEINTRKNQSFEYIYRHFSDGIVIFDDCRGYIGSNVDNDRFFRQLLLDFRHKMLDLFFVVHSPTDVPPRVWGFATSVFVGATDALIDPRQVKTHSAQRIMEIQQEVNEHFRAAKQLGNQSHYGLFVLVEL
ncbi:MAG: hypothetical protein AAF242_10910 [Bacteroidota bacterium]